MCMSFVDLRFTELSYRLYSTVPVSLTVSFDDVQYCITNTNLLPYLSTRVGRIRTKSKLKYLYDKTIFNIYEGTTLRKFLVEGKNQKTLTVGKG